MKGRSRLANRFRPRAKRRSVLLGVTVVVLVALVPAVASAVLTFAPHNDFNANPKADPIRVGDFNSDGKLDLVVANWSSSVVSVLLGTGTGSFGAPTAFAVKEYDYPYGLAVGDFNADGKQDLVTSNINHTVSVLLGTGTGSFDTASNLSVNGGPNEVAVGDLNGDSKQDLVTANWYDDNIAVLLGNGDGTFAAPTYFTAGANPTDVAIGDFNGDGKKDLVTVNFDYDGAPDSVSILLGNGAGSFGAASNIAVGSDPWSIAIGDVNNDGKLDLAVTDDGADAVSVLLGNGNGTFAERVSYSVGTSPSDVELGDLNADGKQDLVVTNYDSNNVSVLLGTGSGSFETASTLSAGNGPGALAFGDFNSDGSRDMAVANSSAGTVSIILNAPTADPDLTKLTFGSAGSPVRVGTLSSPLTVTLTNNGSAPLVVTGFEIGGAWPEDFVSQGSTCTNRIAVGSNCTVKVRFAPNAKGSRTATLTVKSNAPTAREIALAGTGRAAVTGKLVSAKLSKKSFPAARAGKVKLSCKFSPKSKIFRYTLALKKGKKWAVVKRVNKTGSFKTYKASVKKLFAGKRIKHGNYRLNLTADTNSKSLRFKIT